MEGFDELDFLVVGRAHGVNEVRGGAGDDEDVEVCDVGVSGGEGHVRGEVEEVGAGGDRGGVGDGGGFENVLAYVGVGVGVDEVVEHF